MRQDAELAVRDLPPPHGWAPAAHVVHGVALALACADDADRELAVGVELAMVAGGARTAAAIGLAFRAALAIGRSAWAAADEEIRQARRIVLDAGLVDHAAGIVVHALAARIAAHRGAVRQAESDARHAERLRSTLTYASPWLAIRVRLDLGATLLALADPAGARVMVDEIAEILRWQPEMGSLVDEFDALRMHVTASTAGWPPSSSLTAAELRLLPLLATHLSFRQIATSRNVSANTVKTQAKSIYRKLDAGSRSDAVEHARAYGLLEPATVLEQLAPTPQARA
jgi:LuxR family maltose regulon positive regulatory protein